MRSHPAIVGRAVRQDFPANPDPAVEQAQNFTRGVRKSHLRLQQPRRNLQKHPRARQWSRNTDRADCRPLTEQLLCQPSRIRVRQASCKEHSFATGDPCGLSAAGADTENSCVRSPWKRVESLLPAAAAAAADEPACSTDTWVGFVESVETRDAGKEAVTPGQDGSAALACATDLDAPLPCHLSDTDHG